MKMKDITKISGRAHQGRGVAWKARNANLFADVINKKSLTPRAVDIISKMKSFR